MFPIVIHEIKEKGDPSQHGLDVLNEIVPIPIFDTTFVTVT